MKYKKLTSKFPDQKLVRFISTNRDCPLSLKERWVYSTLLWRFKGKPVTKARIARWTGVDRTRTLPRILSHLRNLRLVVEADKKFKAVNPPDDQMPWFSTWDRGVGANERLVLSYNWAVYDRSRDIIDNLVVCADADGHHAAAKLAKRFGVCAKTITAARRRLLAAASQPRVKSIEVAQPLAAMASPEAARPSTIPAQELPPEHRLAAQLGDHLRIEPQVIKEIARLCRLLKGLSPKEIGQVVSALVAKYGVSEGLEDAVYHFIRTHQLRYFSGASLERVLADIGQAASHEDDDLSLVGDASVEFATAV